MEINRVNAPFYQGMVSLHAAGKRIRFPLT